MAQKSDSVRVAVVVPANIPLPATEGANFFHFTVAGPEVQMLVGSVNLLRIQEARERAEREAALGKKSESVVQIVPDITHRFLLSQLGFDQLKSAVNELESPSTAAIISK